METFSHTSDHAHQVPGNPLTQPKFDENCGATYTGRPRWGSQGNARKIFETTVRHVHATGVDGHCRLLTERKKHRKLAAGATRILG
jgi:hypothetical protein